MEQNTLYRKYRPKVFEDVVGQDVIVRTLRNQIEYDRVGHAYLFCGTRGTGKTTIAKIFARAINCKNVKYGSPCNACPTCLSAIEGANLNISEVDAASNNSVDNIRNIISLLDHPPVDDEKHKVFIIDEVHSLSPQASNALLKTLEEPPEYAVFILCTTDPEKLLETIRSRCQRYDFTRIEIDVIKKQLKKICDCEGMDIDDEALTMIATKGDGSMRDSISLLERCRGFIKDEKIDINICKSVLGTVDTSDFKIILRGLLRQDVKTIFERIGELIDKGKDINVFVSDFIWYLRNVMVAGSIESPNPKLSITVENFSDFKEMNKEITIDTIIYYIEKLSELEHKLKYSMEKRIMLETALLKLATPQSDFLESSVLSRISIVERNIDESSYAKIVVNNEELKELPVEKRDNKIITEIKVDKATYEEIKNLEKRIDEILSGIDMMTKNIISNCKILPTSDKREGEVNLIAPFDSAYQYLLERKEAISILENNTKKVIGKEIKYNLLNGKTEHFATDIMMKIEDLKNKGIEVEVD